MAKSAPLRSPKYRFHKARQCAVVTIGGRDHYLGTFGSQRSWEQYHRLVAEHFATKEQPLPSLPADSPLTVTELIAKYWQYAKSYYVKNGQPTSEVATICSASPAPAGRSRSASNWRKAIVVSTNMKSAVGSAGTGTSRSACSPSPPPRLFALGPCEQRSAKRGPPLIRLSVPEVRTLLLKLLWTRRSTPDHTLDWSG
jgi:hypothetical protein